MLYKYSILLIAGFGLYTRSYKGFGFSPGFRALRFSGVSVLIRRGVFVSRVSSIRRGGILTIIVRIGIVVISS